MRIKSNLTPRIIEELAEESLAIKNAILQKAEILAESNEGEAATEIFFEFIAEALEEEVVPLAYFLEAEKDDFKVLLNFALKDEQDAEDYTLFLHQVESYLPTAYRQTLNPRAKADNPRAKNPRATSGRASRAMIDMALKVNEEADIAAAAAEEFTAKLGLGQKLSDDIADVYIAMEQLLVEIQEGVPNTKRLKETITQAMGSTNKLYKKMNKYKDRERVGMDYDPHENPRPSRTKKLANKNPIGPEDEGEPWQNVWNRAWGEWKGYSYEIWSRSPEAAKIFADERAGAFKDYWNDWYGPQDDQDMYEKRIKFIKYQIKAMKKWLDMEKMQDVDLDDMIMDLEDKIRNPNPDDAQALKQQSAQLKQEHKKLWSQSEDYLMSLPKKRRDQISQAIFERRMRQPQPLQTKEDITAYYNSWIDYHAFWINLYRDLLEGKL